MDLYTLKDCFEIQNNSLIKLKQVTKKLQYI